MSDEPLTMNRLADIIDPRTKSNTGFGTMIRNDYLIAASDALRSSTTAIEIGRAMERERCAAMADKQARAYVAYVGQRPNNFNPIKRVDRIARAGAANACHDLATAIRSAAPEIDMEALVEKVANIIDDKLLFDVGEEMTDSGGWRYTGEIEVDGESLKTVARAVLSTLTARQQEK